MNRHESSQMERARLERVRVKCASIKERHPKSWSLAEHFEIARFLPDELDGERMELKLRDMVEMLFKDASRRSKKAIDKVDRLEDLITSQTHEINKIKIVAKILPDHSKTLSFCKEEITQSHRKT